MNRPHLALGSVQMEARAKGADVWTYRYRDGKHHRNVLLGRMDTMTEQATHKKAHRLRSQVFENRSRVTVSVLIDRYLAEALPERMSTGSAYRSRLKRVRAAFGETLVDEFLADIGSVERWLKDLQTIGSKNTEPEPASRRTKNHFKSILYLLGEYAMKWNMVEVQRNPMDLITVRTGCTAQAPLHRSDTSAVPCIAGAAGAWRSRARHGAASHVLRASRKRDPWPQMG
jgi:hypothetical protein